MLLKSFADFPRFNHVFPSSEKSDSGLGGFPFILRNFLSTILTPGNFQLPVSFEMRNSMAEHFVYFCGKHGRYSQTGKVVASCMANKINRIFFCDTCDNLKADLEELDETQTQTK